MILYAIIMFVVGTIFGVVAMRIYKGKTELIHDYHQAKVTDKAGYGKAFGRSMGVIAGAMALSGAVSLFGQRAIGVALCVLAIGLLTGIVAIVCVQKKYNGGVF